MKTKTVFLKIINSTQTILCQSVLGCMIVPGMVLVVNYILHWKILNGSLYPLIGFGIFTLLLNLYLLALQPLKENIKWKVRRDGIIITCIATIICIGFIAIAYNISALLDESVLTVNVAVMNTAIIASIVWTWVALYWNLFYKNTYWHI
jgi:hypothetical protein